MIASIATLALAFFYQGTVANPCASGYTQNVWDPRFEPGQRWSYSARPQDKGSTVTILKIDEVPGIGTVIQIVVDGVLFDDSPERYRSYDRHSESLAIRRDSLDTSVTAMLGITQVPSRPDHYDQWQNNCNGLTYATTVADTMQTLQDAFLYRVRTSVIHISLQAERTPNPQPERFILTASVSPHKGSPFVSVAISMAARNKQSVAGAIIELRRSGFPQPISLNLNDEAKQGAPSLIFGGYDFKLTLKGFQPLAGNLYISQHGISLTNLRSSP